MILTSALHTYFQIGNINKISISGFEGVEYIDKTDNNQMKKQTGNIIFNSEVNRIYFNSAAESVIHDPVLKRKIRVKHRDSNSIVVWNPWIEKCELNPDMEKSDYLKMVCVETVKTGSDRIELAPGTKFEYAAAISTERFK